MSQKNKLEASGWEDATAEITSTKQRIYRKNINEMIGK